jgi:hypothetical protein
MLQQVEYQELVFFPDVLIVEKKEGAAIPG